MSVTDLYVVNLAIADVMLLVMLPFLSVEMLMDEWVFGNYMCKVSVPRVPLDRQGYSGGVSSICLRVSVSRRRRGKIFVSTVCLHAVCVANVATVFFN